MSKETPETKLCKYCNSEIPDDAKTNDILHIIIEATNDYKHKISRFTQIIIKIN